MYLRHAATAGVVLILTGFLGSAGTPTATGGPTAEDVSVQVRLGRGGVRTLERRAGLRFEIVVVVETAGRSEQLVTVGIGLPPGLSWGPNGPDPSEGCTGTAPAACTRRLQSEGVGTVVTGWSWDVVAARPGTYEISVSVVPTEPDPDLSNNRDAWRFDVVAPSEEPRAVAAGAVELSPRTPRAGALVTATVRVRAGGALIRPTRVRCTGSVGSARVRGVGRAGRGFARCSYRPAVSAIGKTLRGAVFFKARGQTLVRRFSTRLR
jgi:hypothetical protein